MEEPNKALAAQHIPVIRIRLIRYYDLYSSKSKGKCKWQEWDHVAKHAPNGWREQNGLEILKDDSENDHVRSADDVSHNQSQASWARLIARIYEGNPLLLRAVFGKIEGVVRAQRRPYIPVVLSRKKIINILLACDNSQLSLINV